MSIILTDIASVLSLTEISKSKVNASDAVNSDVLKMIQNIILCDSIIIDKEVAKKWGALSTCDLYEGVFNYVESLALSKDNNISKELSLLRKPQDKSLRIGSGKQRAFILGAINYLNLTSKLNVYYCPHSYRDKLVKALLNYNNNFQIAEKAISYFEQRLSETSAFKLAGIDLKVPAVAEYAFNFAEKNKCDLATAVNEIRNLKSSRQFRVWCNKLDEELSSSKRSSLPTMQKMTSEIDKAIIKWGSNLDDGVKYYKRQISLRKIWGVGDILSIFGLDKIEIKDPVIISGRYENLIFLNDIYRPPPVKKNINEDII